MIPRNRTRKLFRKETAAYAQAKRALAREREAPTSVVRAFEELLQSYYQLLKRSISITRMTDAMQNDLLRSGSVLAERNGELQKAQRALEHELEMARRIQNQLLPQQPPQVSGLRIHSEYLALQQVGGDFLDYHVDSPSSLGLLVADAAGHGVPAALVGAMSKMVLDGLRGLVRRPAALLHAMSESLLGKVGMHYVTACYAYYVNETKRLTYSVAGHPPPFLMRAGDSVRQLPGEGNYLGVFPDPALAEWTEQLQPGDRVVFITDGILECRAPDRSFLDYHGLERLLNELGSMPADGLASQLIVELRSFMGPGSFEDDVTLLVMVVE